MVQYKNYADQWGSFSALVQEAVSGGQFVKAMSQTAPSSTQRPDQIIEVMLANASGDEKLCVGIATNNAASGERVTVATRGLFKTMAVGTCVAGYGVMAAADANCPDGVKPCTAGSYIVPGVRGIGTSLHDAVSGEYVFVNLNAGGL